MASEKEIAVIEQAMSEPDGHDGQGGQNEQSLPGTTIPLTNLTLTNHLAAFLKNSDYTKEVEAAGMPVVLMTGPGRAISDMSTLEKMREYKVSGKYEFYNWQPVDTDVVQRYTAYEKKILNTQSGANLYTFRDPETDSYVSILGIGAPFRDGDDHSWKWFYCFVAAVPQYFAKDWIDFATECERINSSLEPDKKVFVVGGKIESFVPNVNWEDVILPDELKESIQTSVSNFFNKGVGVYKKHNLKPFRKFLLAGPPGTGKTMICTAIAKKAIEDGYIVIYVSSAKKAQGDRYGSTFDKMEYALQIAASSKYPAVIIIEEIDAYLHSEEKALILNVLDGNESPLSEFGTLLIATTNYPEAIDERIMKRPGRLDRIFVIPETKKDVDTEKMLRMYLGDMWRDEHLSVVPLLVGYTGAFIREVCISSLTQCACDDLDVLTPEMLEASFKSLKEQIDARDAFLSGKPEFKQFTDNAPALKSNGKSYPPGPGFQPNTIPGPSQKPWNGNK